MTTSPTMLNQPVIQLQPLPPRSCGDQEHEEAQHGPADRDRDGTTVLPGERERRKRPGQDRDDRERDREVGEPGPCARKLLPVAEIGKPLLVRTYCAGVLGLARCRSLRSRHSLPPAGALATLVGQNGATVGLGSTAPYGPDRISVNHRG